MPTFNDSKALENSVGKAENAGNQREISSF